MYEKPVFGVDPKELESRTLDGYEEPIPLVLILLSDALFGQEGHLEEGIFRIAPSADNCAYVKDQLNRDVKGIDLMSVPVHTVANLIKVWFRELPEPMLQCVRPEVIEHTQSVDEVAKLFAGDELPQPNRTLLIWLFDLCVRITAHSAVNKMNTMVFYFLMLVYFFC